MRQVVLDTETTGLWWEKGHRVVEIGCVELIGRNPTGRNFHRHLNPDRELDPAAAEITGLSLEFLQDKPRFADVAAEFLDFVRDAELVIHNAPFDLGFLDAELARLTPALGRLLDHASAVLDSLVLARQRFPGQRNSLDALCKRLAVDHSHRALHGALLDAELLAEVYLALTSGQSELELASASAGPQDCVAAGVLPDPRGQVVRRRLTAAELLRHQQWLESLAGKSPLPLLWQWDESDAPGIKADAAATP